MVQISSFYWFFIFVSHTWAVRYETELITEDVKSGLDAILAVLTRIENLILHTEPVKIIIGSLPTIQGPKSEAEYDNQELVKPLPTQESQKQLEHTGDCKTESPDENNNDMEAQTREYSELEEPFNRRRQRKKKRSKIKVRTPDLVFSPHIALRSKMPVDHKHHSHAGFNSPVATSGSYDPMIITTADKYTSQHVGIDKDLNSDNGISIGSNINAGAHYVTLVKQKYADYAKMDHHIEDFP